MNRRNTALEKQQAAPVVPIQGFTRDQVDLIKTSICKGASDDELKLFLYQCNRLRLDPLAGQVHAVRRWDDAQKKEVMKVQTGIDGFRLNAERSGHYRGQDGPYWCGDDGVWFDVWLSTDPPKASKVGVYRDDFQHAIYAVARYDEYCVRVAPWEPTNVEVPKHYWDSRDARIIGGGKPIKGDDGKWWIGKKSDNADRPNAMWSKMPANQLAKCAEALALRKAFPQELGGIHTDDEMAQTADHHAAPAAAESKQNAPTPTEPAAVGQPSNDVASTNKLKQLVQRLDKAPNVEAFSKVWSTLIESLHPIDRATINARMDERKARDATPAETRELLGAKPLLETLDGIKTANDLSVWISDYSADIDALDVHDADVIGERIKKLERGFTYGGSA